MGIPRSRPLDVAQDPSDLADLALVAAGVAAAVLAILVGSWWLAIVGAVPSLLADILRGDRPPRLRRFARRILLDRAQRSLVRNGAVAVAIATTRQVPGAHDFVALLGAVMVIHGALTAYSALAARRLEREGVRILWRHLRVGGAVQGPPPLPDPVRRRTGLDGLRATSALEILILAGFSAAAVGSATMPTVLAVVAAALAATAVLAAWRTWSPSGTPDRDTDSAVAAAVERLAPEVVFYFSSPASGTYALAVWAQVINAMRRPVLVVVREAVHLDGLGSIHAPLVVAPTVADLIAVTPPSVRVVLYPTNVVRNNEMVRIPGPMHCFIGHGDSDKVGSFSPLNRMYDEIWVAGRAAIDRYAAVDEGIDLTALRAVGRPQLAEIRRADVARPEGQPLVVLYAPTWEGFFDEADYSSVASMGVRIARSVVESGAVLRFKPHPLTGHRIAEAGRAVRAIRDIADRAGNGSGTVPNRPDALYAAFNEADVLVSDISSVITDFLASRKPYVVTNPRDLPEEEFRRQFPSSGAAALLGSDVASLRGALADANGADVRRPARAALAEYLLGPEGDPLAAFLADVDRFVERSSARSASSAVPPGVLL